MRALLLTALLLLGGCTSPVQPGTTDTPTPGTDSDQPSPSPALLTTPQGRCAAVATPAAPGNATKPYPEPPESHSNERVGAYVREYERAYRYNDRVTNRTRYIEVYATVQNVTRYGDAYVVRLTAYTNGGYEKVGADESTSGGTPVVVHWDGAPEHVAYLVTSDRLLRLEGDHQTTPPLDDIGDGVTLACL